MGSGLGHGLKMMLDDKIVAWVLNVYAKEGKRNGEKGGESGCIAPRHSGKWGEGKRNDRQTCVT